MTFAIGYRLVGTGWAACDVSNGQSSCHITASYLSDALGQLVLAATAVAAGFRCVTFNFDEEPGEYRWVITSPGLNEIEVEILSFDELYGDQPDSEGRSVFKARCPSETFAKAVQAAALQVLDTHGEAEYLERWMDYPFPTAQLAELTRLITSNTTPHPSPQPPASRPDPP